jgi:hypothetical protein
MTVDLLGHAMMIELLACWLAKEEFGENAMFLEYERCKP